MIYELEIAITDVTAGLNHAISSFQSTICVWLSLSSSRSRSNTKLYQTVEPALVEPKMTR